MNDSKGTDSSLLVHAYIDGELDPAEAIALEQRMAGDPALLAERARIDALRRLLAEHLPPTEAPPGLRRRVEAAIGMRTTPVAPRWRAMAASVALGAVVAGGSTWAVLQQTAPQSDMADSVVASHMRGLLASQATDVTSGDRHTVKPWFNGRIPQAPRVVDLGGVDFPLVGGRVDVIDRTPVPTLVYRRRQHVISLVAVPSDGRAAPAARRTIDGYNLLGWSEDGVHYWAVSDLNARELGAFSAAFRAAARDP